ncbi:MAG TPA: DUF4242 domain-containing protein [Steroidobacteraceae bacterium]|jgi:hypothetical protein
MPRYLIEREFPAGCDVTANGWSVEQSREVTDANVEEGVTWIVSYVDRALQRTFCLYEAPTPEAIRAASGRNGLPIKRITEVRVVEPDMRKVRLNPL